MSGMHLLPPMYSTTGKKRGKQKWESSEQKRKAEALRVEWERTLAKIDKLKPSFSNSKNLKPVEHAIPNYSRIVPPGRETPRYESRDSGGGSTAPVRDMKYTGDKIKGIGVMHKSNGVPVFSDQEAKDISSMRR